MFSQDLHLYLYGAIGEVHDDGLGCPDPSFDLEDGYCTVRSVLRAVVRNVLREVLSVAFIVIVVGSTWGMEEDAAVLMVLLLLPLPPSPPSVRFSSIY